MHKAASVGTDGYLTAPPWKFQYSTVSGYVYLITEKYGFKVYQWELMKTQIHD